MFIVARLVHPGREFGRVNKYMLLTFSAASFSFSCSTETEMALSFVPDWAFESLVADAERFLTAHDQIFCRIEGVSCVNGRRRQVHSRVSRGFRAAWTQVSVSVGYVPE